MLSYARSMLGEEYLGQINAEKCIISDDISAN